MEILRRVAPQNDTVFGTLNANLRTVEVLQSAANLLKKQRRLMPPLKNY